VRYYGPGFAGWAWRAEDAKYFDDAPWSVGAFSAAAATQKALAPLFANDTNASNATRPLWCAGRTDKGVHGLAQTVSFTVADDLEKESRESEKKGGLGKPFRETVAALVAASPAGLLGHLRVVASPAPREAHRRFHATFCATWRRYVYVFPTRQSMREERTPRREIDVSLLNEMLGRLVRKEKKHPFDGGKAAVDGVDGIASTGSPGVDCYAFARDTVAGKDSRVVFRVARAFRGHVPRVDDDPHGTETRDSRGEEVIVIELVANRFLRKLVRVLVATAAREAATGAKPDVLLALAAARERSATASAAPPNGLFFAGVGYGDHPEYDEA
jgi:tRNA pseudouridine(38-40) synthase